MRSRFFSKAYKGRSKSTGPNKLEQEYGHYLELRRIAGDIKQYMFERVKLKLADNTFYTVDYFVVAKDDVLEAHEVKGYWEDDARVKIKVAAEQFPFRFVAITRGSTKGSWEIEEF